MKRSDPIIMLRFSASRHAFTAEPENAKDGQIGLTAVLNARWSEINGDTVTSYSEHWKLIAPNIWQVTSPKR